MTASGTMSRSAGTSRSSARASRAGSAPGTQGTTTTGGGGPSVACACSRAGGNSPTGVPEALRRPDVLCRRAGRQHAVGPRAAPRAPRRPDVAGASGRPRSCAGAAPTRPGRAAPSPRTPATRTRPARSSSRWSKAGIVEADPVRQAHLDALLLERPHGCVVQAGLRRHHDRRDAEAPQRPHQRQHAPRPRRRRPARGAVVKTTAAGASTPGAAGRARPLPPARPRRSSQAAAAGGRDRTAACGRSPRPRGLTRGRRRWPWRPPRRARPAPRPGRVPRRRGGRPRRRRRRRPGGGLAGSRRRRRGRRRRPPFRQRRHLGLAQGGGQELGAGEPACGQGLQVVRGHGPPDAETQAACDPGQRAARGLGQRQVVRRQDGPGRPRRRGPGGAGRNGGGTYARGAHAGRHQPVRRRPGPAPTPPPLRPAARVVARRPGAAPWPRRSAGGRRRADVHERRSGPLRAPARALERSVDLGGQQRQRARHRVLEGGHLEARPLERDEQGTGLVGLGGQAGHGALHAEPGAVLVREHAPRSPAGRAGLRRCGPGARRPAGAPRPSGRGSARGSPGRRWCG